MKRWWQRRRVERNIRGIRHWPGYRDNTHLAVLTDVHHQILHYNRTAEVFFGAKPQDIANRDLLSYFADEDRAMFKGGAAHKRRPQPYIMHGLRLKGLPESVILRMYANAPQGFYLYLFESTQVAEEVLVAREERKWSDRLQIMLFGISHELKTPLAIARGYAEMAEGDSPENVAKIMGALDRISLILNDMTEPLREFQDSHDTLDLGKSVEMYTRTMTYMEPAKRYVGHFAVDFEAGQGLSVRMTKARFYQILTNLFDNAIRATDHLGEDAAICIHLRPCIKPHHGDCVTVVFSDNGVGMSPDVQKMVFTPYFTTRAQNTGTGLGGYFIYQYVMDAGGNVEIESALGCGSTFILHLPYTTR